MSNPNEIDYVFMCRLKCGHHAVKLKNCSTVVYPVYVSAVFIPKGFLDCREMSWQTGFGFCSFSVTWKSS